MAGNVIPDVCVVDVNYRFAPDRTEKRGRGAPPARSSRASTSRSIDSAPGALPGLDNPAAAEFVAAVGQPPIGKFGWTDVARFAALGVPALNFGPGDPNLAHKPEEKVEIPKIRAGAADTAGVAGVKLSA